METETEEEYLIFPCDESSGSLSSSISLSDKSVSTDNNVEEFVGDVPFAGKNFLLQCNYRLQWRTQANFSGGF